MDAAPLVPGLLLDVRYARADNVFGRAVYDAAVFALRRSVATRLARVQADLASEGLALVAFDGYRPLSVQRLLWEICPVPGYVAPPERGSNHNRGTAVDVGLARAGAPLPMPSGFDEFSERAHADFAGGSEEARRNRDRLRGAMERHGFSVNSKEWWHFDAPGARDAAVADVPLSSLRDTGRAT